MDTVGAGGESDIEAVVDEEARDLRAQGLGASQEFAG
jgi:hypothetical protein